MSANIGMTVQYSYASTCKKEIVHLITLCG